MTAHNPNYWGYFAIIFLLLLLGCSADPQEGQFTCESNDDCPGGWLCNATGDQHCYSDEDHFANNPTDGDTDSSRDSRDSDTTADTDTESDTDTGSDTDTVSDSETDTDAETDTGSDTDTNTVLPGSDCNHPIVIDTLETTWSGNFSDFSDSFTPSDNSCGDGTTDIWFALTLYNYASSWVEETTGADVTIAGVEDCNATTCTYFETNPEKRRYSDGTGTSTTYLVNVSAASSNSNDTLEVTFSN